MAATRILVAEDNDLVALTLVEQLKSLGYDVIGVARTGVEAIDLTMRLDPDVIMMDVRMPEMEGTEAAARINQQRPTPIVMMTAYSDPETVRRADKAGVMGYLVKPVREGELSPMITIAKSRFADQKARDDAITVLRKKLEERKMIEKAKGILIDRLQLSEADAYERIRRTARNKRVTMVDIARQIIEANAILSNG